MKLLSPCGRGYVDLVSHLLRGLVGVGEGATGDLLTCRPLTLPLLRSGPLTLPQGERG